MNNLFLKSLVLITYIAMIVVNWMATSLPINGINTGAVSDLYPNLFAPAGITFSIWGIIYLSLLIYILFRVNIIKVKDKLIKEETLVNIDKIFIFTSIVNLSWIFLWHYLLMPLTVVLMLILLILLIKIANILKNQKFSPLEKLIIKFPFSVYFGWITVATIANITVLLVSLNWNRFNFPEEFWAILIIIVGAIIGNITSLKYKNIFYGLVLVWAYFGIYLKHTSIKGFNYMYPTVILIVTLCIFSFLSTLAFLFLSPYINGKKNH